MAELNPWARAHILINYPSLAWAIDHPELGPILNEAVSKGWTEEVIVARVKQTSWYRTTSDAQRQWELLRNDNPGEAAKQVSGAVTMVGSISRRLGISLSSDQALWIATSAVANGWNEQQITANLVQNMAGSGQAGQTAGELGYFQDLTMARAKEWGVPMGEDVAFMFAKWMATGESNQQNLDAYLRDQAMSRFPTLQAQFEMGFTTKQIFDPYIQQTAQLLELSPAMIDITNQKWMPMIDSVGPDGTRRPMSLSEAGRYVRGQDEYNGTQQATEQAARLGETILQTFGQVA